MNFIVAVDKEWGIGYKGDLLVRSKEDLKNFAALTTGKVVILGSNTLATFPGGRVLKNRVNIVLHPSEDYAPEGAIVAHSIEEAVSISNQYPSEDVFVIGGASVYKQMLPYCNRAYVTKLDKSYIKDAYFPDLDADPAWRLDKVSELVSSQADGQECNFYFTEYVRI